jgi:PBP1b-binding outer membrane lipoprotein LpoB
MKTTYKSVALIGLMAVILAGCAVPYREPQPDWGGISREVGRIINQ